MRIAWENKNGKKSNIWAGDSKLCVSLLVASWLCIEGILHVILLGIQWLKRRRGYGSFRFAVKSVHTKTETNPPCRCFGLSYRIVYRDTPLSVGIHSSLTFSTKPTRINKMLTSAYALQTREHWCSHWSPSISKWTWKRRYSGILVYGWTSSYGFCVNFTTVVPLCAVLTNNAIYFVLVETFQYWHWEWAIRNMSLFV